MVWRRAQPTPCVEILLDNIMVRRRIMLRARAMMVQVYVDEQIST